MTNHNFSNEQQRSYQSFSTKTNYVNTVDFKRFKDESHLKKTPDDSYFQIHHTTKMSKLYVREFLNNLPQSQIEKVELTNEALKLADTYISEKVVGKNQFN